MHAPFTYISSHNVCYASKPLFRCADYVIELDILVLLPSDAPIDTTTNLVSSAGDRLASRCAWAEA